MKKLQMTLLMMCGIALAALPLIAETETVGGYTWTYRINGDTAEIYKGGQSVAITPKPTGTVTIPATLGGKPVTRIGYQAFYGCSDLMNVTIPNSVTRIGDGAFSYCRGLTSVILSDSVTDIGDSAFYGCVNLTSVTIPDSVTSIGANAFSCRGLLSVTIGKNVEEIGALAFNDWYNPYPDQYNAPSNLVSVVICSTNLHELGEYAFPSFSGSYDDEGNVCDDVCSFSFIAPSEPFDTLPRIHRRGASFVGWWTEQVGGVKLGTIADVVPGQTYYAHWSRVKVSRIELAIPDTVTVWDDDWQKITIGEYNNVLPDFISAIYDENGNVIEGWQECCTIEIYHIWDLETPFQFDNYSGLRNLPGGEYIAKVTGDGMCCEGTATVPFTVWKRNDSYSWNDFTKWWLSVGDFTYTPDTSYYPSSEYDGSVIDLGVYSAAENIVRIYVDDSFSNDYGYYYNGGINIYADVSTHRMGDSYDDYLYGLYIGNYYDPASMPIVNAGDYRLTVTINGYLEHDDEYSHEYCEISSGGRDFDLRLSPASLTNQTITTVNTQSVFTGEEISPATLGFTVSMSEPTTYYMENVAVTNAGVYAIRIGAATTEYDMTCIPPDEKSTWIEHLHYVKENPDDLWSTEHLVFNYTGVVEIAYTVLPRPVLPEQARVVPRELHCDGTPQTCSIVITNDYNGAVLVEGRDYDVAYSNNILAGTATATVTCKGNYTGTFSQNFEILPSTNVVEVLGLDKKWTTGGNAEWFAEWFEAAHDGVSCMRSGAIGDNQESWIETVVTNTGVVSFWWKASSEAYRGIAYDKAVFSVDGVEVASIGGETDWTNVTYNVEGNGPHALRWTYRKDDRDAGGQDCAWLDEVLYLREVRVTFEDGGATDGSVPAAMTVGEGLEITLPGQGALAWPKHSFSGWRINDDILAPGTPYTLGYDDVLFTAAWEEKKVADPTIEVAAWYDTERTAVTMGCETVGAVIHYTLDGSTPTAESPVCTGSFYLAGSATIKAIAVLDDYFDSDVVSAESVRAPWTPGECLNVPSFTFSIGGDATWFRDRTVTHDSDTAMRSGAIGDGQTSWIETSVSGAGTLTFWWKVSSEAYKGSIYDYARFTVDGDAAVPDIGGEIDWRCETITITGSGVHTLRWAYVKDSQDKNGSDCAWLDEVTWTPVAMHDPIPPVVFDDEVAAALAGTTDASLVANVTNAAQYAAYRDWALSVTNDTTTAQMIKESTRTWLSYALGTDALIDKEITSNDVRIVAFEAANLDNGAMGSSRPTFAFEVAIDNVNIGGGMVAVETLKENLKKVLGVEGTATLSSGIFSSDNIEITFDTPVDGKARFTVSPPADAGNSFFMRVKVK